MSIDNTQDTIDSCDIIARIEELEGQQTPRYVAGWNMPGYMPDMEPQEFDNAADAREFIAEQMESYADTLDAVDHDTIETLKKAAGYVRQYKEGEYGETISNLHYWVTQDGVMGLDAEEKEELAALQKLASEAESSPDWNYGEALIRDSYFVEYTQQLVDDCYTMPEGFNNGAWPWRHMTMDWEAAADELKADYFDVDFDGVTYWIRG